MSDLISKLSSSPDLSSLRKTILSLPLPNIFQLDSLLSTQNNPLTNQASIELCKWFYLPGLAQSLVMSIEDPLEIVQNFDGSFWNRCRLYESAIYRMKMIGQPTNIDKATKILNSYMTNCPPLNNSTAQHLNPSTPQSHHESSNPKATRELIAFRRILQSMSPTQLCEVMKCDKPYPSGDPDFPHDLSTYIKTHPILSLEELELAILNISTTQHLNTSTAQPINLTNLFSSFLSLSSRSNIPHNIILPYYRRYSRFSNDGLYISTHLSLEKSTTTFDNQSLISLTLQLSELAIISTNPSSFSMILKQIFDLFSAEIPLCNPETLPYFANQLLELFRRSPEASRRDPIIQPRLSALIFQLKLFCYNVDIIEELYQLALNAGVPETLESYIQWRLNRGISPNELAKILFDFVPKTEKNPNFFSKILSMWPNSPPALAKIIGQPITKLEGFSQTDTGHLEGLEKRDLYRSKRKVEVRPTHKIKKTMKRRIALPGCLSTIA